MEFVAIGIALAGLFVGVGLSQIKISIYNNNIYTKESKVTK